MYCECINKCKVYKDLLILNSYFKFCNGDAIAQGIEAASFFVKR